MVDADFSDILLMSAAQIAFAAVVLLLFGFWMWMLFHCITNPVLSFRARIIWAIVIFLGTWVGALVYAVARPSDLRALVTAIVHRSGSGPRRAHWWAAASVSGFLLLFGLAFAGNLIHAQRVQAATWRQTREATVTRLEALLAISRAKRDGDYSDVVEATLALDSGDAMSGARAYADAAEHYQRARQLAERAMAKAGEAARSAETARAAAEQACRMAQALREEKAQSLRLVLQPKPLRSGGFGRRGWLSLEAFHDWTQSEISAAQEALQAGDAELSAKAYAEAAANYERAKALAERSAATAADAAEAITAGISASNAIDAAADAAEQSDTGWLPGNIRNTREFAAVMAAQEAAYESLRSKAYKNAASEFAKAQELAGQFVKTAEPLARRLGAAVEEARAAMEAADRLGAQQYVPTAWRKARDRFYYFTSEGTGYREEPGSEIRTHRETFIANYEKTKEDFDHVVAMTQAMRSVEAARRVAETYAAATHAPAEWNATRDRQDDGLADEEKAANAVKATKLFETAALAAEAALAKMVQAASQDRQTAAEELGATLVAWSRSHPPAVVAGANPMTAGMVARLMALTRQSVPVPVQKGFQEWEAATQSADAAMAALRPYSPHLRGDSDSDLRDSAKPLYSAMEAGGEQPIETSFVEARERNVQAAELARHLTKLLNGLQAPLTLRSTPAELSWDDVKSLVRERFGLPSTTLGVPPVADEAVEDFQNVFERQELGGDAVVVDHRTGLMWVGALTPPGFVIKPKKWDEAKAHLMMLNNDRAYAGFRDWRLPTMEELLSLVEFGTNAKDEYIDASFDLSLSRAVFPNFWSADKLAGSGSMQWAVSFAPAAHVTNLSTDPSFEPSGWVLAVRNK